MMHGAAAGAAPASRGPHLHLRAMRAASTLLTRLPLGGFPYSDAELEWSLGYAPLVGAALGGGLACVSIVTARGGPLLSAVIVVVVALLVTGALHEDGLADTADALGGGATRERIFEILKDSRIGTFGAAALAGSLLLRVASLAHLRPEALPAALVLASCASRTAPTLLAAWLPYVTPAEHSKSRAVVSKRRGPALVAGLLALVALGVLARIGPIAPARLALSLAGGAVAVALLGARFRARLGGVTGDFLGAAQQVCECVVLAGLALG